MATNPTIGYVVIELDEASTGASFSKLGNIVKNTVDKIPDVVIRMDEKGTAASFSKLSSIVNNEIQKIQSSVNAFGNITINGLDINNSLRTISSNINLIKGQLDQLINSAKNVGNAGSAASKNLIAGTKEYETRLTKLVAFQERLNSIINKSSGATLITDPNDSTRQAYDSLNNLNTQIVNLIAQMQSGKMTISDWDIAFTALNRTLIENASAAQASGKILTASSKEYESRLTQLTKKQNELKESMKNYSAASGTDAYELLNKASIGFVDLENNLKAGKLTVKQYDEQYSQLVRTMESGLSAIKNSSKGHKSFLDIIKGMPAAFGGYFTSAKLVGDSIRFFNEAKKAAIELQDALVDLKIVTGESGSDFENYASNVSKTAQSIGVATKDLITATTTYARLGYSLEESDTLAKYTAMLEKVGGISAEDAQNSITAMLKAFPDDVNIDNIEQAMDKLVTVGNKFPISVSQIATGMNNASSSLAAAGSSFDEAVALLMGGNVTVQDASKASTALRTISARIYKTTSELNDLGESIEESKYNSVVSGLTGRGVSIIDEQTGEYRKLIDILRDVSKVWGEMSSLEQSALLDTFGATRGRDVLLSIINNFDSVEEAMSEMENSGNALENAYAKNFESITTSINSFKAALGGLGYEVLDDITPALKSIINLGSGIVNILTTIVQKIGGIKIALPVIASIPILIKATTTAFAAFKAGLTATTAALAGLGAVSKSTWIGLLLSAIPLAISGIIKLNEKIEENSDLYAKASKNVSELKGKYEEEYGTGSEYETLLNTTRALTDEEQKRLAILTAQADQIERQIKTAEQEEYLAWQNQNGTGARDFHYEYDFENDAGFGGSERKVYDEFTKDVKLYNEWNLSLDEADNRFKEHEYTLQEYSAFLGDFVSDNADTYSKLSKWEKQGYDLSDSQRKTIKLYEEATKRYEKIKADAEDKVISARRALEEYVANRDTHLDISNTEEYKRLLEEYNTALREAKKLESEETIGAVDLSKNIENLSKEHEALNNALQQQNETGSLSVETYRELISVSPDYASCLEYVNGMIVLNTENAKALYDANVELAKSQAEIVKSAAKLKYKKNAEEIRKLSKDTKALIDNEEKLNELYSEQHRLSGQIIEAELLVSELNSAANAYNRFKELFDGAKTGTENYDDFLGVLEEIKDFIDNDMLGSGNEKLSEFLKFALPENWAGGIEDYYKKVLSRYFTENNEGYKNFVADAKKAGLVTEENGQIIIDNTKTWEDWTNQMQMTSDVLDTFIRYSSVFKGTDLSNWAAWDEHNQIDTAIQQELEAIKSLQNLDEQIEAARAALREANAEGNEDAANTWAKFISAKLEEQRLLGEDLGVDLSEIDGDLQKIYDTIAANQENAFIGDLGAQEATTALAGTYNQLVELLDLVKKAKDSGDLSGLDSIFTLKEPEEGSAEEDVTRGISAPGGRNYVNGVYKAERIGEGLGIGPVGDPDSLAGRFSETAEEVNIDVTSMISDIESLRDELVALGEEYNSLVNGNVDYNKRPILSAMDMIKAGWDIAEEDMDSIFTTYSKGYDKWDLGGDNSIKFSIDVTPILENGDVLSEESLDNYVRGLVLDGTKEELLASDYLKLIVNVDDNPEWDSGYWDQFYNSIDSVKQEHASLIEQVMTSQGIINQGGEFVIKTNADETINKLNEVANYKIKDKSFSIKAVIQNIGSAVNSLLGIGNSSASGTSNAVGGKTLVNELGPELISANGKAYIANGGKPAVVDLPAGAIVLNADETKRALGYSKISQTINALASGTSGINSSTKACINCGRQLAKTASTCPVCGSPQNKAAYLEWKRNREDTGVGQAVKSAAPSSKPTLAPPDSIKTGTGSGSGGSGGSSSDNKKEETWFEKQYKEHQHLLAMDKESVEDYLRWLNDAYQRAYNEGIMELDDYRKYCEEVYSKLQEHFKDYLNDNEFEIEMLEHQKNAADQINTIYRQLLVDVRAQIDKAYAQGLRDTDDYVQELWQKWWEYYDAIEDLRDSTESDAKDALDELVQYRIKMLEKDLENEKKSYDDRLNSLKEFIDKQKEILRNDASEEDYLKEQADKRKKVSDLEAQLAQLEFDDSAWAQKKKLELQEELTTAREDLQTFERDHAIEMTENELDAIYELSEEASNKQTEIIQKQLDDASVLYNRALEDIKNNSEELYKEMMSYELEFGSGTSEALKELWEEAYKSLQKYRDLFGEFYNGVELKNLTGYTNDVVNTSLPEGSRPGYVAPLEGNYSIPSSTAPSSPVSAAPSLEVGSYVDVKSGSKWYEDSYGSSGKYGTARGGTIKYTNPGSPYPYNIDGAGWIRKEDIVGYKNGTSSATKGLHSFDEDGSEYIFTSSDGNKYKLFNSGDKVLNSKASQFLYDFANKGASVFNNLTKGLSNMFGNIGSLSPVQITMGNIVVNGNADERTVSEIRRAQRENVDYMLREFRRLKA